MRKDREELIDLLLGELSPERAHALEERLAADPALAAERALYGEAIGITRAAAVEGWPSRRARLRYLRPVVAAAAVLAVAVGVFLLNGAPLKPRTLYEPDGAYGYLRPEETDSQGRVYEPASTGGKTVLRSPTVEVASLGSERSYELKEGDEILPRSEINASVDAGVRIDLPFGGILFLGPLATVQLRARDDGETALRLMHGEICTVAGRRPIHLAVHGTDLLLAQDRGAAFLRHSPSDAVCLRGELHLRLEGGRRFRIPEGERLPGACANEPRTVPAEDDGLCLDWYRALVYRSFRVEDIAWEKPGISEPLETNPGSLLYLRVVPRASGSLAVAFGGEPRVFSVRQGLPLALRVRFGDLGPGARLRVQPPDGVREARLFEAVPR